MAYVKRHAIKTTLNKALKYITSDEKTDESCLIYSNQCSDNYKIAYKFMQNTKKEFEKIDKILGFHFIQSFSKDDKITPQIAHEIGIEWSKKFLDNYEYILTTHIDKGHIHNHIICNSVSYIDGKKYNSCKDELKNIRQYSDEIIKKYGLTIIDSKEKNSKYIGYKEYMELKNGNSFKEKVKKDIDFAIISCNSYDNFIDILKNNGYEIKNSYDGKYISFKNVNYNMKRFLRGGKGRSLGESYSKENILKRIEEKLIQNNVIEKKSLSDIEKELSLEKYNLGESNSLFKYLSGGFSNYYNNYDNKENKEIRNKNKEAIDFVKKGTKLEYLKSEIEKNTKSIDENIKVSIELKKILEEKNNIITNIINSKNISKSELDSLKKEYNINIDNINNIDKEIDQYEKNKENVKKLKDLIEKGEHDYGNFNR